MFRVRGSGIIIDRYKVQGTGFRAQGSEFKGSEVQSDKVSGVGFQVSED